MCRDTAVRGVLCLEQVLHAVQGWLPTHWLEDRTEVLHPIATRDTCRTPSGLRAQARLQRGQRRGRVLPNDHYDEC